MTDTLATMLRVISPSRRKQFWGLVILIAFSGGVELLALGSIALFVSSLASLESLLDSSYMTDVTRFVGIDITSDPIVIYMCVGGLTVFLVLIKNLLSGSTGFLIAKYDGGLNADFGKKLLKGVLDLPYEWSANKNSSDTMQVIAWKYYIGAFASHALTLLGETLVSVLLLSSLFILQPAITIGVVVGLGLVSLLLYSWLRRKIDLVAQNAADLTLSLNRLLMKSVQGVKDVKIFNNGSETLALFERDLNSLVRLLAVQRLLERCPAWGLETFGVAGLVVGAIVMLLSVGTSSADVMGTLALFAISAWRLLPAISRMVAGVTAVRSYMPYLQRVLNLVREIDSFQPVGEAHRVDEAFDTFSSSVNVNGVTFQYSNSPSEAIRDVTVAIPKGAMVGIIGRSGAGKSTLADLLIGLISPKAGNITIDGIELAASNQQSWFTQVGFVPQAPYLFDGSLAENIAFTTDESEVDSDRVADCCEQAGVLEFLDELTDGMNTRIGERGVRLSGGQAQRVSIARALYRNPAVLIFDEATSSLDNYNERIIRDTILELSEGRTLVVIAHRLTTVRDCDLIIWMEKGRVRASGPPDKILPEYEAGGGLS